MIGIDITKISRFKHHISRYNNKFNTNFLTIKDIAKFWAVYESLIKLNGKYFNPKLIKIEFHSGQPPKIKDTNNIFKGNIFCSITHEDDYVIAVSILQR